MSFHRATAFTPRIRASEPADEPAVIALWQRAGVTRAWNDPARDILRKLAFQSNGLLVADNGETIVGTVMVGYEGHRGWINYLAVCPEHQRQGVGTLLMQHAERMLRELDCPKINLQVRCGNEAAIAFYRAIGYAPDEVVSLGKRLIDDTVTPKQSSV